MKVPLNWLREYCSPELDTAAIEERLTMTGTKVETVIHHGVPAPDHFVVGRVLTVEAHPKADRLRVCEVDVGADAPAGIVCGAPNVAAGQTVAVALPGATMPGGTRIEAAKLRGVPSAGMILSAEELGIHSDHDGIMVLDELIVDADRSEIDTPFGAHGGISDRPAPGTALEDVLAICTDVLELEITPNRPDCLGVYGVARELHAATGAPLAPEPWAEDPGSAGLGEASVEIVVECPDLCKRFTARVFEDVTIGPSPPWLAARLSAAGQRPINNVVDITNYVMLVTGQPLHAFDLDRVAGARLTVRRAKEGERVTTLDGQMRTLDGEMVVIEDAEGPTSIAGIMGGERSEVGQETSRVLMEVANWSGPNIHRTSWKLGLRSEASGRFEKGLAPEQCMWAQALATRLMIELCSAKAVPGTIDVAWEGASPQTIRLREQRVEAILGTPVPRARQAEILRALGFDVRETAEGEPEGRRGLDVTVPAARREDVAREADLIEEVARINGLESLPATLPARRGAYGRLSQPLGRRQAPVGPPACGQRRRPKGCDAAWGMRSSGGACMRWWAGRSPPPRCTTACGSIPRIRAAGHRCSRTRCRRTSRCCAPPCWVRCLTWPPTTQRAEWPMCASLSWGRCSCWMGRRTPPSAALAPPTMPGSWGRRGFASSVRSECC
jgi:phenylalanyl-tRNA synthetase beta chain